MRQVLFDRGDVLNALLRRVEGLQAGYRQNLALLGPEGMGKTSLLKHLVQERLRGNPSLVCAYVELHPKDHFVDWVARCVQALLYALLQAVGAEVAPPGRLSDWVSLSEGHAPETAAMAKRVMELADAHRWDDAYNQLWDLPQAVWQETGRLVLLVLDEFHRLRAMPVRDPFRSLGRKIMVQGSTLFLLSSSQPVVAREILREGLALLFGQFETIEMKPLTSSICRKAFQSVWPEARLDPFSEYLLLELAQGHAESLSLVIQAVEEQGICAWEKDPHQAFADLLEALFLRPGSVLAGRFEDRLRSLPLHRDRRLALEALAAVAGGLHGLASIAEAVDRSASQVARALRVLEQDHWVVRNGVFRFVPERLFQLWMVTAYPVLYGVGLGGSAEAVGYFRQAARTWVEKVRQAVSRPFPKRLMEMMALWGGERVEVDGKRTELPKFERVELDGTLLGRPLIAARRVLKHPSGRSPSHAGWLVIAEEGAVTESEARQMVQALKQEAARRGLRWVLMGARPVEINARLILQEGRVRLWDSGVVNDLLDLTGLARLLGGAAESDPGEAELAPLDSSSHPPRGPADMSGPLEPWPTSSGPGAEQQVAG